MDLYFSYHDGQAVTCDDFVEAMSEANGVDLDQFMRWYSQRGTPTVHADVAFADGQCTLTLTQSRPDKDDEALQIPVAVGFIGADGMDLPLRLKGEVEAGATTRVLQLKAMQQQFVFEDIPADAVPSLLRGFSAPVVMAVNESDEKLAFRMANDADPFNRWDATQRYMTRTLLGMAASGDPKVPEAFISAFDVLLNNEALDPAFRAVALTLPSEPYLLEQMDVANPAALRTALMLMSKAIGTELAQDWLRVDEAMVVPGEYRYHPADAGKRALRNLALRYLCAANIDEGVAAAGLRVARATNMTERFGALFALVQSPAIESADLALKAFEQEFGQDALVMDKWFSVQASAWRWSESQPSTLERVEALTAHPAFSLSNPNKIYSLFGGLFRNNPAEFHRADGAGYRFWADRIRELNARNPQVCARMARMLENWRRYTPELQEQAKAQIEALLGDSALSPDVREVLEKALG